MPRKLDGFVNLVKRLDEEDRQRGVDQEFLDDVQFLDAASMSLPYADIHDIQNANGWIIDTSAAVCLQTAQWTEALLELPVAFA